MHKNLGINRLQNMSAISDRLIGIVSLNHKYVYDTSVGNENTDRPELTDHKHCNILFQLNTHLINDSELRRNVLNTVLHSDRNNVIWTDIGAFENILMSLNFAAKYDVNKIDYYTSKGDSSDFKDPRVKSQNKYDAIAPFNKIILKNVLTEKDMFIDYEKSIPLSGPILKLISTMKPKAIAATDAYHSVVNQILNSKLVTVLSLGLTSDDFPLQIPTKRCFFAPNHYSVLSKVYMVIAPYSESIIPETCSKDYNSAHIFSEVGLCSLTFNIDSNSVKQIVQYPSYAISYMIVPSNWSEEAVASEVIKRCKHYTQSSNLALESCREIAVLYLGEAAQSLNPSNMIKMNVDKTTMYILKCFHFSPGEWYHTTFSYKRHISVQRNNLVSEDDVEYHSVKKDISVTSLAGRLFRSQQHDNVKITSANHRKLNAWTYNNIIENRKNDTEETLDEMLLDPFIQNVQGQENELLEDQMKKMNVKPIINALREYYPEEDHVELKNLEHESELDIFKPDRCATTRDDTSIWDTWTHDSDTTETNPVTAEKKRQLEALADEILSLEEDQENIIAKKHKLQGIIVSIETKINDLQYQMKQHAESQDAVALLSNQNNIEKQSKLLESNIKLLQEGIAEEDKLNCLVSNKRMEMERLTQELEQFQERLEDSLVAKEESLKRKHAFDMSEIKTKANKSANGTGKGKHKKDKTKVIKKGSK